MIKSIIFCNELFSHQKLTSNFIKSDNETVLLIGKKEGIQSFNEKYFKRFIQVDENDPETAQIYKRIMYLNSVYHSTLYTQCTKRINCFVELKCGTIVEIISFVHFNAKCYIVGSKYTASKLSSHTEISHIFKIHKDINKKIKMR